VKRQRNWNKFVLNSVTNATVVVEDLDISTAVILKHKGNTNTVNDMTKTYRDCRQEHVNNNGGRNMKDINEFLQQFKKEVQDKQGKTPKFWRQIKYDEAMQQINTESDGRIALWKTRNGKYIILQEIKECDLAEVVVNDVKNVKKSTSAKGPDLSWITNANLKKSFESHFQWLAESKQELEGTRSGKIAIQHFKIFLDEMVNLWKRCLKNSEKVAKENEVARIAEQDYMDDAAGTLIETLNKMRKKVVERHQSQESQHVEAPEASCEDVIDFDAETPTHYLLVEFSEAWLSCEEGVEHDADPVGF